MPIGAAIESATEIEIDIAIEEKMTGAPDGTAVGRGENQGAHKRTSMRRKGTQERGPCRVRPAGAT